MRIRTHPSRRRKKIHASTAVTAVHATRRTASSGDATANTHAATRISSTARSAVKPPPRASDSTASASITRPSRCPAPSRRTSSESSANAPARRRCFRSTPTVIATRPCSQSAASCSGTSVKSASVQAVSQDESRRPSSAARPRSHQVAIHSPVLAPMGERQQDELAPSADARDLRGKARARRQAKQPQSLQPPRPQPVLDERLRDPRPAWRPHRGLVHESLCLGDEWCGFRLDERAPQRRERQHGFPMVWADHGQPAATPFDEEHECVRAHSDDGRPGRAQHRLDLSERRVDGIDVESQPSGRALQRRVRIRRAGCSIERPRARAVREAGRPSQELQPFGQAPGGPADGSDVDHSPTCGLRGVSRCRVGDAGLLASCRCGRVRSGRLRAARSATMDLPIAALAGLSPRRGSRDSASRPGPPVRLEGRPRPPAHPRRPGPGRSWRFLRRRGSRRRAWRATIARVPGAGATPAGCVRARGTARRG